MAVDTRERRQSVASLGLPWMGANVTPAPIDVEWHQESGYSYPGITPSGSSPVTSGPSFTWQESYAAPMMQR